MSVAAGPTVSVGGTMGAGRAIEPPVNKNTVPRTMLRATAAFKPKEAYQRQSRFWALSLDLLGIYSSKFRAPLYHKPESGQMFDLPVALPGPFGLCGSLRAEETRRVSIPRQKLTLPYTLALWECQALTPPRLPDPFEFGKGVRRSPIRCMVANAIRPGVRRTHAAITDKVLELRVAVRVLGRRPVCVRARLRKGIARANMCPYYYHNT